jgi:hypothetical protein
MKENLEIGYVNIITSKANCIEACRQHNIYRRKLYSNKKINFSSKRMKEQIDKDIQIELKDYYDTRGCVFHGNDLLIYINLNNLKIDFPIDTEKHICETISHETIHLVLRKLDGLETSSRYDSIYQGLRIQGFSGC